MKKIFLAFLLAALIILSGCVSGAGVPASDEEVAAALISKAQRGIGTHTFEGFTGKNTYADCLAGAAKKANVRFYSLSQLSFNAELLGYPARLVCGFTGRENNKALLRGQYYVIDPGGRGGYDPEEFMSKLCDELGDFEKSIGEDATYRLWERDGLSAWLMLNSDNNGMGCLAVLSVYVMDSFSDVGITPDIFHFKFGTDIKTVCGETPGLTPRSGELCYEYGGIIIYMWFEADDTGALTLRHASYEISIKNMELGESLKFFESAAAGLEDAAGSPGSREYIIPNMRDGKPISFEGEGVRVGCSAQDVLDSGADAYRFILKWPGISFNSTRLIDTSLRFNFSEEYFNAANK